MGLPGVSLTGKSVLVAGGDGAVVTRLVESLVLEHGATTRVLIDRTASAVRLARVPVRIMRGEFVKPQDVDAAIEGCEVVFNCISESATSDEAARTSNAMATKVLLESCRSGGVTRCVHLGSSMVYGCVPSGEFDEAAPRQRARKLDTEGYLAAETIALRDGAKFGVPVVVLQPTQIYGPFASTWTVNPLNSMKLGRVILVNGGDGLCNAVYVDDVVSALILAATKENVVGESFLISGKSAVTWREFYARYENMLGVSATIHMSMAEAIACSMKQQAGNSIFTETLKILREEPAIRRRIFSSRELAAVKKIAGRFLSQRNGRADAMKSDGNKIFEKPEERAARARPIIPISASMAELLAAKSVVRIDKAKRLLNYHPVFDIDSGMRLTEHWARWAGLLPNETASSPA